MFLLRKPQVKPVENADWEKDSAGKEKTPFGITKTKKDVCKPCNKACDAN
jgi:hypothetical protein